MTLPGSSFASKTTSNEHFKDWKYNRAKSFADHPSFAGESLFPTHERNFETSTNSAHYEMAIPKKVLLLQSDAKGSLALEGNMEFNSAYRDNYQSYPSFDGPPKPIIPNKNEVIFTKSKFKPSITQNQKDFIFHADHRPPKPADCNPFISKIDQDLYPGNR